MKPKQIWANLAVKDLDQATRFYTALGFKPNGQHNNQLTSFSIGDNGFVINFFLSDFLKTAMQGQLSDTTQGNEIMFTLSAENKDEVNAWAEEVRTLGGNIFTEPAEFGPGYYGFGFADPDGHKWNVFYM